MNHFFILMACRNIVELVQLLFSFEILFFFHYVEMRVVQ